MANAILVRISSEAWVKEANSYMNVDQQFKTFFPDDCFIARGTGRENEGLLTDRGIVLQYKGASEPVRCFMELRAGGQFRPSNRGAIKSFYKATGAKVGDSIRFEKVGERSYLVDLANRTG